MDNNVISQRKNTVLILPCDYGVCGNIRLLDNARIMSGNYQDGNFIPVVSSRPIYDDNFLETVRAVVVQRCYTPAMFSIVAKYKDLQEKYGYRIIYDIDDLLFNVGKYKFPLYLPSYDLYGDNIAGKTAIEIMKMCDAVNVSTLPLADAITTAGYVGEINYIPNTIPLHLYSNIRKPMRIMDVEKPHVLYAGSKSHYKKGFTGDFTKNWIDWITKNVESDKITFTMMGEECPDFLQHLQGRENFKFAGFVKYLDFPNKLHEINADFQIAPLAPNWFNACKSNIKALQSYATDAVFIGTRFGDIDSPYDDCKNWVYADSTVDEIDAVFWELTNVDIYNNNILHQREYLLKNNLYSESKVAQSAFALSLCVKQKEKK